MTRRLHAAAAFAAGALVAVQSRINGALGEWLHDGVEAAAVTFALGLVLLLVAVTATEGGRRAVGGLPGRLVSGELSWWMLLGGLGGATYVTAQTVTVATLGVALFTVSTVAGQTGMGLGVDRAGLGPTGQVPVTGARVAAAVLATVAVGVAAWGRGAESGGGGSVWALVLLALTAGGAVAFQAAFNGRVAQATGRASVAALVNFVVGLVAVLAVLVVSTAVAGATLARLPSPTTQWWLYLGGPMGVVFVVTASWAVRGLGVLLFALVVIAGQLLGAVVVDVVAPTPAGRITPTLVVGLLMTFFAVVLAGTRPRRGLARGA